jgi:rhamnose transport system permease protein
MNTQRLRALLPYLLPGLLLAIAVAMVASRVSRPAAVLDMWRPWGEIGALASVMTAIMLTGGIDLSVGAIMALACVSLGRAWQAGWPLGWATVAALAVGLAAGAINGTLVVAGIAPLVATLATMAFYAGAAMAIARGQRVPGLPVEFTDWGQGAYLGLPNQLALFAVVLAGAWIVVHHTRFGRYLYALGDNRTAAQFAALPLRSLEWSLYAASGLTAAAVAVVATARGGAAVPTPPVDIELQTIACVVLGGTRVTGGYGGLGRTLLGVAILSLLDIGLQFSSLSGDVRPMLLGALVIGMAIWNQHWSVTRR